MEPYEVTRMVYARVQAMEPENVSKIMGYLLLQDQCEPEMLRLALGSDYLLQSVIARVKKELCLGQNPILNPLKLPVQHSPQFISSPSGYGENGGGYSPSLQAKGIQDHGLSPGGGVFPNDHFYPETFAFLNKTRVQALNWDYGGSASPTASAWKPCLYFARGYCKHGSSCRFLHGPALLRKDNLLPPGSPTGSIETGSWDDECLSSASLDRLESELQELLRGRKSPISIASLPQLYYERFGRTLQAEGYLTESQRHGKAGFSLTRLLARLKNTVTLIDRPHGQHAVVLAEDAYKYTNYRDLNGLSNSSSRQIYLTFPAESTFTEEDVSAHFRAYGPVQDVRIPYQQKRMFGFVTFVYSETVKTILSEGNPHYVCGARVLVKPYREKGKHSDRKQLERPDQPRLFNGFSVDGIDYGFPAAKFPDVNAGLQVHPEVSMMDLERRIASMQLNNVQQRLLQVEQPLNSGAMMSQAELLNNTLLPSEMQHFHLDSGLQDLIDALTSNANDAATRNASNGQLRNGDNLPDNLFSSLTQAEEFSLPEEFGDFSCEMQATQLSTPTPSMNMNTSKELGYVL